MSGNKEQINYEVNGRTDGEKRNQESGNKSISRKDIEKAMKEKDKN
ncbi:hypothetical protein NGB30_01590 [Mammaliicoccus fleurettii]|nr:hypothetical protein [Mammaliicoccus fleurettii]MEB7779224.1 hypothetical protein [Mammaliicoccus fleurettii]